MGWKSRRAGERKAGGAERVAQLADLALHPRYEVLLYLHHCAERRRYALLRVVARHAGGREAAHAVGTEGENPPTASSPSSQHRRVVSRRASHHTRPAANSDPRDSVAAARSRSAVI